MATFSETNFVTSWSGRKQWRMEAVTFRSWPGQWFCARLLIVMAYSNSCHMIRGWSHFIGQKPFSWRPVKKRLAKAVVFKLLTPQYPQAKFSSIWIPLFNSFVTKKRKKKTELVKKYSVQCWGKMSMQRLHQSSSSCGYNVARLLERM